MKQTVNPYEVEMLDLWNEVGGQMVIKYHRATIKPDKGDLQQLRDKGFKTDVMACIMSAFIPFWRKLLPPVQHPALPSRLQRARP